MKRLLVAILFLSSFAFADETGFGQLALSCSAVTTTGACTTFNVHPPDFIHIPQANSFTWQTIISGGTATSITVVLQGSIDGTTFSTIDTSTSTSGETRTKTGTAYSFFRCNVTAYNRNGTTASCQITPSSTTTGAGDVASVNGEIGTVVLDADDVSAIPTAQKAAASGVASLDADSKVVQPATSVEGNPANPDSHVTVFDNTTLTPSPPHAATFLANNDVAKVSENGGDPEELEKAGQSHAESGASYTILKTDKNDFITLTANNAVLVLPQITSDFPDGFKVKVKNDTFTTQTINATSPTTIDSAATTTFTSFQVLEIRVMGSVWRVGTFSPSRTFAAYEVFGNMTGTAAPPTRAALVAAALPTVTVAKGGTGTTSTLTGLVRGSASAMTAAELSGVVVTSASNVTTPGKTDVMQSSSFCSDAGANDTYTCDLSPAATAYVTGTRYRFKGATANTGASTINFNSLGAKTIKKAAGGITTDLADNDIVAGQWVDLVYDGTNMQMVSLLGNAPGVGTDLGFPMTAFCNAVVGTANTTSYVLAPSAAGTTACTSSTNNDPELPVACTAQNLRVRAGAAGAQAGSGVITLYQNGSATSMTCTLGTTLLCNDSTHTVAFAANDRWAIKVLTGQATDTTANIRASFLCK